MGKRFAEHGGLNLTQVNNDILQMWKEKNVFLRSIEEREGCPQFVFFEGPPRQTDTPVFTTCWHAPSRIPSTVIRPCVAIRYTARRDGTPTDCP